MNIRRVEVQTTDGQIVLRLFTGHASAALPISFTLDAATALVAAGRLEAAVHAVCPAGIAPFSAEPQIPNQS